MPQKRHTVDQIVAKLRKADVKLGKGKTHSSAASVAASLMWIGVRACLGLGRLSRRRAHSLVGTY